MILSAFRMVEATGLEPSKKPKNEVFLTKKRRKKADFCGFYFFELQKMGANLGAKNQYFNFLPSLRR